MVIANNTTDWLTAIGTVGAVVVALGLTILERLRAARDNRRRQAELITAWADENWPQQDSDNPPDAAAGSWLRLVMQNGSAQLAYFAIASVVGIQGAGPPERAPKDSDWQDHFYPYRALVGRVPPGQTTTWIRHGGHGMHIRVGIELAFQDAAGRYWLRRGTGQLRKIKMDPIRFYEITPPVVWEGS